MVCPVIDCGAENVFHSKAVAPFSSTPFLSIAVHNRHAEMTACLWIICQRRRQFVVATSYQSQVCGYLTGLYLCAGPSLIQHNYLSSVVDDIYDCVTGTAGSLLVAATVPVEDEFGWTTLSAMVLRQVSYLVNTTVGEITRVAIVMTSLSAATQVLLAVYSHFWRRHQKLAEIKQQISQKMTLCAQQIAKMSFCCEVISSFVIFAVYFYEFADVLKRRLKWCFCINICSFYIILHLPIDSSGNTQAKLWRCIHFYRAAWNAGAVQSWEDCPSLRPFDRLSNAWFVTKRKKVLPRFLYQMKERLS